ncbi:MAG: hypothetical protein KDA52_05380 [Planctomycetaceae bacterium]|nr:hypothetical protein [Planctomycetaceae bacterium]
MPNGIFHPQDDANLAKLRMMGAIYDHCCVCQVFSAVYVEAAANLLGELGLGKKYFTDHLEKLDPTSKLLLLVRILDGYDIDKSDANYCHLVELFKSRNRIMHPKLQPDDKHTADPEIPFAIAKKGFMAACETGKLLCDRDTPPTFYGRKTYEYQHRI